MWTTSPNKQADFNRLSQPKIVKEEEPSNRQNYRPSFYKSVYRQKAKSFLKDYLANPVKELLTNKGNQMRLLEHELVDEKRRMNELLLEQKKVVFLVERADKKEVQKILDDPSDKVAYNREFVSSKVDEKGTV